MTATRVRTPAPVAGPHVGDPVQWGGRIGSIIKRDQGGRNVWADLEGTVVMFSVRADASWRAFPYRADAPPLMELTYAKRSPAYT